MSDLFGKKQRRKKRILMHVVDAGIEAIKFKCKKCGYSDWYYNDMTISESKKGLPCPMCSDIDDESII